LASPFGLMDSILSQDAYFVKMSPNVLDWRSQQTLSFEDTK
jgi:hypothetical protein